MKLLTRYWITFEPPHEQNFLYFGIGVTAYDFQDAMNLMKEGVFKDGTMPTIKEVVENVDIRTLEGDKHIRPMMGVCTWRGIWFPKHLAQSGNEWRIHSPD